MSEVKLRDSVSVGPDIGKLICDIEFDGVKNNLKQDAWLSFKDIISKFLDNNKGSDYKQIVTNMFLSLYPFRFVYGILSCNSCNVEWRTR